MVIPVQIHIAKQNWLFKIGPKTGYHSIHSLIIIPKLTSYLVSHPRVIERQRIPANHSVYSLVGSAGCIDISCIAEKIDSVFCFMKDLNKLIYI